MRKEVKIWPFSPITSNALSVKRLELEEISSVHRSPHRASKDFRILSVIAEEKAKPKVNVTTWNSLDILLLNY